MKIDKILVACCSTLVLFSSCKKWLDINEDPANPQVATGEVLLSPLQSAMANNVARDSRFIGKYVQFWNSQATGNADTWDRHGYVSDITDVSGDLWRMVYFNLGRNLELMIKDGVDNEKYGFAGIGYAIKAWAYQIGTDYHGPMILDEVFDDTKYVFKYNDQPEVYAKVREWSALAIEYLNKTGGKDINAVLASASGDLIYKGDLSKWRKFVYGNLALQYSHLTSKAEFKNQYADSVLKYADLSFVSAADDAAVFHNASVIAENNPLNTLTNTTVYRIGTPVVALLTGGVRGNPENDTLRANGVTTTSLDPRLSRLISPSADSVFRGVIATVGDVNAANTRAVRGLTGKYVFNDKAVFPLTSYAQLQFAKAEAAFIKGNATLAHGAYLNGIKGHMAFVNTINASWASTQTPISTAEINSYLTSSEVAQTPDALTIMDIMLQKYIAQWGWAAVEQWTDLRKYRYDTNIFKYYYVPLPAQLFADNKQKLAQRVRPRFNSEYVWNRGTLNEFGALNSDYHTYELWFSKP